MTMIAMRSITFANKGKETLNQANIWCNIRRAPGEISSCGCVFVLALESKDESAALDLLYRWHIPYDSIWRQSANGSFRKVG